MHLRPRLTYFKLDAPLLEHLAEHLAKKFDIRVTLTHRELGIEREL